MRRAPGLHSKRADRGQWARQCLPHVPESKIARLFELIDGVCIGLVHAAVTPEVCHNVLVGMFSFLQCAGKRPGVLLMSFIHWDALELFLDLRQIEKGACSP